MLRKFACLLPMAVLLTGCVEQTQVITLNPDGRGKIEYEIRGPGQAGINAGPGAPGGKEKSLAEMLTESVTRELTKPGITAWKNVSAKWAPDGKLHFKGTAYFDRVQDLHPKQGNNEMNFEMFDLDIDKDKGFTLKLHKNPADKKKPTPDIAKMTDKELDEYVMKQRIQYQSSKGIIIAMFTDLRIKTEIRLPGEVQEIKGFKKKTARVATRDLDGAEIIAGMNKLFTQDDATLKKFIKSSKSGDLVESFGAVAEMMEGATLTVPKLGAAQFDYEQEVKDARTAYPALRKQLSLGDKVKLPGE